MSTWSDIYFESDNSDFGTSQEWGLVYRLPWYIGSDYLDCFGWDILERRTFVEKHEKYGYPNCPDNLSAIVKNKWNHSVYRFVLELSEFLLGAELLQGLSSRHHARFKEYDQQFVQVGVSLVNIFQNNKSSLRIIHLVS